MARPFRSPLTDEFVLLRARFVHRRNSTSITGLDPNALAERIRLGLVVHEEPDDYQPSFNAEDEHGVRDNYPAFETH